MRERITFFEPHGQALDSSTLIVDANSLSGPDVDAAREDRLTLALDELPRELRFLLATCQELHIRWSSSHNFKTVGPLVSRLPPGFHLLYSPRDDASLHAPELCQSLARAFGEIDCSSPAGSFTRLPRDLPALPPALQYFQPLHRLAHFTRHVKATFCASSDRLCAARVERLSQASSMDITYDGASRTFKVTTLSPLRRQPLQIESRPGIRTEVGILATENLPHMEPHELGSSGILTVLEQNPELKPTMFTFSSRHRQAEAGFSAGFERPTGLHPTLTIRIESNRPSSTTSGCSPHAYLTFPRTIFPDHYQLGDALFLASHNLTALKFSTQPLDLEAPEYVVNGWGSAVLFELAAPVSQNAQAWTAEIPLHLRYLQPNHGGYATVEVPYPAIFWACDAEGDIAFAYNPFDRVSLGYDGLFGPNTVFWHVEPSFTAKQPLLASLRVPVLDLNKSQWVNAGTSAAILAGFLWVAWKLLAVYLKSDNTREPAAISTPLHEKKTR